MIPDVPFVEGEVDLLSAVLLPFYRITDRDHAPDEVIHIHRPGKEARRVAGRIGIIAMERDIVDIVIALVQHGELPVAEGRHLGTGGAAGHEFDGGVDPLHHLGGLVCGAAVFISGFLSHLPGAVHLVSEAPELDPKGLLLSVRDPEVGERTVSGMIGILYDISRLLRAAGAEIDRVHDLTSGLLCPAGEFVEPNLVGLGCEPRKIQPLRALLDGADTVLPAEAEA